MRFIRLCLGVLAVMALAAGSAFAQTTSGTITGRVTDNQNLAVPGVTITVEGPNLQGALSAVSSENGDSIVPQHAADRGQYGDGLGHVMDRLDDHS